MDPNPGKTFNHSTRVTILQLLRFSTGYLYTFEVNLQTEDSEIIDIYRLKIGVRSLMWDDKQFLINGRPIYFRGFGKHEDSDVTLQLNDFSMCLFVNSYALTDSWKRLRLSADNQRLQFT